MKITFKPEGQSTEIIFGNLELATKWLQDFQKLNQAITEMEEAPQETPADLLLHKARGHHVMYMTSKLLVKYGMNVFPIALIVKSRKIEDELTNQEGIIEIGTLASLTKKRRTS